MTEADLVGILARGARRLRLNAAFGWACAALLAGLLVGAAVVLAARLNLEWAAAIQRAYWTPLALAVAAGAWGFWRTRPSPARVAFRLDRSAALKEHLTTWEDARRSPPPVDPVAQAFVLAQRKATLRLTQGLRPGRHLPLALPAWSRALWLGLLALGCALLVPPREAHAVRQGAADDGAAGATAATPGGGTFRPFGGAPRPDSFKVELLTPTELFKYQLVTNGPDVPEALKGRALEELEAKIGAMPESDLSPEVRALLDSLRDQLGRAKPGAKGAEGVVTTTGRPPEEHPGEVRPAVRPEPVPPSPVELVGLAKDRFPDVAAALERYYLGK